MPRGNADKPHATRKLERLDAALAKEKAREREIRARASAARAEVQRLDEQLEQHFAEDGHDPEPRKLLGQRAAALAKRDEPWDARIRGQQRRVAKAEAKRAEFAAAHVGELLAEAEPEAHEVAESVGECARAMLDALTRYERVASKVIRIVNADPRMNGRMMPSLERESQQLRRDVKVLATSEVPPPLPTLESDPTITTTEVTA